MPSSATQLHSQATVAKPSSVLIVRTSALGDVSRTVPCLVSLRKAFPQARIDWLVQDTYLPAVAHHPALSNAVAFPRKAFARWVTRPSAARALWQWCRDLRRQRYEMVIDLQGLARSGFLTWITAAPRRIGFANAREGAWLAYNQRHDIPASTLHTVDRMVALVEAAGCEPSNDLRLYLGADQQTWLTQWLTDNDLVGDDYAVLAPTAKWLCKCWPIERFAELGRRILDAGLAKKIVLLAAPHEAALVAPMVDALAGTGRLLTPTTTVASMMALLSRAGLVVCNDSAPLHMAVGFDRRIVCIFGPTDPALVGPYHRPETVVRPAAAAHVDGRRYRHLRDDQSLIAQVTLDEVWQAVQREVAASPEASYPTRET